MTAEDTVQTGRKMRDEVKRVTVQLLLRHGYQGLRFRDIADRLGTNSGEHPLSLRE